MESGLGKLSLICSLTWSGGNGVRRSAVLSHRRNDLCRIQRLPRQPGLFVLHFQQEKWDLMVCVPHIFLPVQTNLFFFLLPMILLHLPMRASSIAFLHNSVRHGFSSVCHPIVLSFFSQHQPLGLDFHLFDIAHTLALIDFL